MLAPICRVKSEVLSPRPPEVRFRSARWIFGVPRPVPIDLVVIDAQVHWVWQAIRFSQQFSNIGTIVLTSVPALQLVEQKQVTLDQPLDQYLPEMSERLILNPDNKVIEPQNSITLRHLLTHTAGFGYWFTSPQLGRWNQLKAEITGRKTISPDCLNQVPRLCTEPI